MNQERANNLFTSVGATFLRIVCLTMYFSLSGVFRPAIVRVCIGKAPHNRAICTSGPGKVKIIHA